MPSRAPLGSLRSRLAGSPAAARIATVLGVVALGLLLGAPAFNYSYWKIDEQAIVVRALGFLDFDFNPRWFGYGALPMYVLSVFYFGMYAIQSALGLVASKIEFVSLLFSNEAAFFVVARVVCAIAYATGVFTLARVVHREHGSALGAVVFVAAAVTTGDAITAASYARVDTFVFAFMAMTVHAACYAPKRVAWLVLSLVFCGAAIACKISAIVLLPVLWTALAWDILRRRYPRWCLALLPVVPAAAVVAFAPYCLVERDACVELLRAAVGRATHDYAQIGKHAEAALAGRLLAPWAAVVAEIGVIPLAGALAFAIWSAFRRRRHVFPFLFALACVAAFSTSSFLDGYWLRPVYPFLVFFFVLGALELVSRFSSHPALLALLVAGMIVSRPAGVQRWWSELTAGGEDARVASSRWIRENLPPGSRVVLCGVWQQFLPRVLSTSRAETLKNTYMNNYGAVRKSPLLSAAFDHYFSTAARTQRRFRARVAEGWKTPVGAGSYVVVSGSVEQALFSGSGTLDAGGERLRLRRFYDFVKAQPLVARFEADGGGGIDIYRMGGAWDPRKERGR